MISAWRCVALCLMDFSGFCDRAGLSGQQPPDAALPEGCLCWNVSDSHPVFYPQSLWITWGRRCAPKADRGGPSDVRPLCTRFRQTAKWLIFTELTVLPIDYNALRHAVATSARGL